MGGVGLGLWLWVLSTFFFGADMLFGGAAAFEQRLETTDWIEKQSFLAYAWVRHNAVKGRAKPFSASLWTDHAMEGQACQCTGDQTLPDSEL